METSSSPSNEPQATAPTPLMIVAAMLLLPLAIFLAQGVSCDFWIAFALTCIGYLQGVVFALFVFFRV